MVFKFILANFWSVLWPIWPSLEPWTSKIQPQVGRKCIGRAVDSNVPKLPGQHWKSDFPGVTGTKICNIASLFSMLPLRLGFRLCTPYFWSNTWCIGPVFAFWTLGPRNLVLVCMYCPRSHQIPITSPLTSCLPWCIIHFSVPLVISFGQTLMFGQFPDAPKGSMNRHGSHTIPINNHGARWTCVDVTKPQWNTWYMIHRNWDKILLDTKSLWTAVHGT